VVQKSRDGMKTAFDRSQGEWSIDFPGRISQHDLVYHSPPNDPMRGIALGNGDVGALCWTEDSRLIIALNKCDLWDDALFDRFHNWSAEEEEFCSTLRHGGRLIIDFKLPVFDAFYLTQFEARLDLAGASMRLAAKTPFGAVEIKAFVDSDSGLLYLDMRTSFGDAPGLEIELQRFGSRTFSHWYSLTRRDPTIGLPGTEATVAGDRLFVSHQLTTGKFAVGADLATSAPFQTERLHSHAVRARIEGCRKQHVKLTAMVTAPQESDPIAVAEAALVGARDQGRALRSHRKAWKSFWLRSFMDYGEDYLNNLWYVTMYYANASQRGASPGRFINGLWNWNRDVQHWNFFFHWNQQQLYWPLNAAGHHDLNGPYLDYRFQSLPHAREDAERWLGASGAVVSDVCERRGFNDHGIDNHTPVAEIAMDFWRQYLYTGDQEFLRNRALPYLTDASLFFESLFELGEDGLYHARNGTAYEGWIKLRDVISELGCARALFTATIEACRLAGSDHEHLDQWRRMLAHFADWPTIANPGFIDSQGRFLYGKFAGEEAHSGTTLAAGRLVETGETITSFIPGRPNGSLTEQCMKLKELEAGKRMEKSWTLGLGNYEGLFPWVEFAPIFPAGQIGLRDRDSEIFRCAVDTVKLFSEHSMGWATLPIAMARLGMARELTVILTEMPDLWQFYPNGWGHYGPANPQKIEASVRHNRLHITDADNREEKFTMENHPFRHMGMEAMSCLATAMNEALLQSHEGMLRITPAMAPGSSVRFSLHAVGGFVVSAESQKGRLRWVHVRSTLGGTCRIANPWKRAFASRNNGKPVGCADEILEYETDRGDTLLLGASVQALKNWETTAESPAANAHVKTSPGGLSELGLPRMF